MVDTAFMRQKYTIDTMVDHYLADIKALKHSGMPPADENQLKIYYQAARVFKGIGVKDLVQFALSFGRSQTGKVPEMVRAFPIVLGNQTMHPQPIDVAYLHILQPYVLAFHAHRGNIKDWLLRFVLSSRFSPIAAMVEREIQNVIDDTQRKIQRYN
jgi:hypothetical protein